jgi:hypothetical protein
MSIRLPNIAKLQTEQVGLKLTQHSATRLRRKPLKKLWLLALLKILELNYYANGLILFLLHGLMAYLKRRATHHSRFRGGYTVFAFDVSPSRRNASLVAGQILSDGRIGVGILQTWESQVSVDDLKIAVDIKAGQTSIVQGKSALTSTQPSRLQTSSSNAGR